MAEARGADRVHPDLGLLGLDRKIRERAGAADACVVDQNVDEGCAAQSFLDAHTERAEALTACSIGQMSERAEDSPRRRRC
jgi:hypothetical protein